MIEKTSIKLYLSMHKAMEYIEKTSIKLYLSMYKAMEYRPEGTSIKDKYNTPNSFLC